MIDRDTLILGLGNGQCAVIDYTNHDGRRATRIIQPDAGTFRIESSEWHPVRQWVFDAFDLEKGKIRTFALSGIHDCRPMDEWDVPLPYPELAPGTMILACNRCNAERLASSGHGYCPRCCCPEYRLSVINGPKQEGAA